MGAIWRGIAKRTNSAIVLIHHTAKPPFAAPDAWVGQQTAARGASAFGGVCRVVATLSKMSERDATKFGLAGDKRRRWVRLDDAKMNLTLVGEEARWFRRIGVTIANGDEVGVLVPGDPKANASPNGEELEAAVLAEIDRAWRINEPYAIAKQSKRYYGKLLP